MPSPSFQRIRTMEGVAINVGGVDTLNAKRRVLHAHPFDALTTTE